MLDKFVTSFPGKRDNYQLVVALQESNMLSCFITDFYNKGWVSVILKFFLKKKIENRYNLSLAAATIISRPDSFIVNLLLSKFFQASKVAVWQDNLFARLAVRKAKKNRANLILYEFQAEFAFKKKFDFPCKKILFHFHTHPQWEHALLIEDAQLYPHFKNQVLINTRQNLSPFYANHTKTAWQLADKIVVASTCTKLTLVHAGASQSNIFVVPYGFNNNDTVIPKEKDCLEPEKPFFLYVGSGTQRKGLHHLCKAWKQTGLINTHELIVIARTVDTGMEEFIGLDSSIKWIKGVSKEDLIWYYKKAVSFVMPSLSEGFGQVYLEALSNGCPVLGTKNSMLVDLPPHPSVHLVGVGDIEGLAKKLILLSKEGKPSQLNQENIKQLVTPYTWERFRSELIKIIKGDL